MYEIEPSFEIDKKGRAICKKHSNYDYFVKPDKDYFQDLYLEIELTCKTCSHYLNNDCYFPKSRIDEIENKREKKGYLCKLCGRKIDRMFTVIHKLFYKETYDVEIPLICCECYEKINNNEFLSYSRKIADFYLLNIVISIFFLCYFTFFISILNIQPLLYFLSIIIIGFVVFLIIFKCSNKLKYSIKGIKYYKRYFTNQSNLQKRAKI